MGWNPTLPLVAALAAMFGLGGTASALDMRVGQAWTCTRDDPSMTIVYVIGALEPAGPLNPADPEMQVAHLAISGIVEGERTVPVDIPHMAFAANRLGCAGQTYAGEGALVPAGFPKGLEMWRIAVGGTGLFIAEDRPVDEAVLDQLGVAQ